MSPKAHDYFFLYGNQLCGVRWRKAAYLFLTPSVPGIYTFVVTHCSIYWRFAIRTFFKTKSQNTEEQRTAAIDLGGNTTGISCVGFAIQQRAE